MAFNHEILHQETIEHELTHVFFNRCCLSSIDNLTIEQADEFIAEFMPKYSRKIIAAGEKLRKIIDKKLKKK
jgi:hypothetical protein